MLTTSIWLTSGQSPGGGVTSYIFSDMSVLQNNVCFSCPTGENKVFFKTKYRIPYMCLTV